MRALFDTNILIDFLNGVPQARDELSEHEEKAISIISWMEVMVGADSKVAGPTRAFLDSFALVPLTSPIAERAVAIRRSFGVKLPDAIVWASADVNSMLFVTRNTKDFGRDRPGIRVPYRL